MTLLTNYINRSGSVWLMVIGLLVAGAIPGIAQIKPYGATFFQNQYLTNPAMAGMEQGIVVNIGYLKQWNQIPESPESQYVTGTYRFTDKVGLGLSVYNEKAGLFQKSKIMATYAYHLILDQDKHRTLHLGLSAGVSRNQIDDSELVGDQGDQVVAQYNDRGVYADGDFGLVFTEGDLTLQGAIPNARMVFENLDQDQANLPIFFAAVSYKFMTGNMNPVGIEPKICYRGITDYDNLLDVGANATFLEDHLNFMVMVHSSGNATIGGGFIVAEKFRLTARYLTGSSNMETYSSANFEVGLKVLLGDQE